MLPIDFTIVGTVPSHLSPNPRPSSADLELFSKYGKIHIIVSASFDKTSWKAYTYTGEEIPLLID